MGGEKRKKRERRKLGKRKARKVYNSNQFEHLINLYVLYMKTNFFKLHDEYVFLTFLMPGIKQKLVKAINFAIVQFVFSLLYF